MDQNNNHNHKITKSKQHPAPHILAGLLPIVFVLLTSFISLSWYIIDYQVEALVAKRTSEYAHSIVKIAADSSAEALLSDDNLQLELLAQNIAKDRYIRTATIYSSDGIVVTQFPQKESLNQSIAEQSNRLTINEITHSNEQKNKSNEASKKLSAQENKDDKKESSQVVFDFLEAKKNIPYIEKIAFKGVTAGWFKIEIDGFQLESDFRANFHRIRVRVFALAVLTILSLMYLLVRYRRKVDRLVNAVNLLVRRKAVESDAGSNSDLPDSQQLWLQQVDNLAETSFHKPIRLREMRQHVRWQGDEAIESVPMVWFAINLPKQDNQNLAKQMVKIEKYVKSATNAYFTFFQGELFSGGVVPFLQHANKDKNVFQSSYSDLVSFTYLMKTLLNSMDANITFKALLFNSRISRLYADDSVQDRVILPQRKVLQISMLANLLGESNIACLVSDASLYNEIAECVGFTHKQKRVVNAYLLIEPSHDIINHVARISKTIIDSDIRN